MKNYQQVKNILRSYDRGTRDLEWLLEKEKTTLDALRAEVKAYEASVVGTAPDSGCESCQ